MEKDQHGATIYEPDPIPNDQPAVWDLVVHDMTQRNKMGQAKYGVPLQPFNGRDPLWDAYQEALDLVVYLRQAIFENEMLSKREQHCAKDKSDVEGK